MGSLRLGGHGDPLERRSRGRMVVVAVFLAFALAFGLSTHGQAPERLPGVALGSPFMLDLERAAVVGGVVAGASIFFIRGWAGYFPSKLSTTGAEYAERSMADKVIGSGDELVVAVEDIEQRLDAVLVAVDQKLAALQGQSINTDDMLGA